MRLQRLASASTTKERARSSERWRHDMGEANERSRTGSHGPGTTNGSRRVSKDAPGTRQVSGSMPPRVDPIRSCAGPTAKTKNGLDGGLGEFGQRDGPFVPAPSYRGAGCHQGVVAERCVRARTRTLGLEDQAWDAG